MVREWRAWFEKDGPPLSINLINVGVRYKDGGGEADGVILFRQGRDDSLGKNTYAQKFQVKGWRWALLREWLCFKDSLPSGSDLVFSNTNKSSTGNKLDAF